jgi:hypothetical protein
VETENKTKNNKNENNKPEISIMSGMKNLVEREAQLAQLVQQN